MDAKQTQMHATGVRGGSIDGTLHRLTTVLCAPFSLCCNSWSARLSALDAASKRLADKTESLNKLLHNLHTISATNVAAVAPVPSSSSSSSRSFSFSSSSAPRTPLYHGSPLLQQQQSSAATNTAARFSQPHTPFSLSAAASASSSPRIGPASAPPPVAGSGGLFAAAAAAPASPYTALTISAAPAASSSAASSAFSSAQAQIHRVQQWLANLERDLQQQQRQQDASFSAAPLSSHALDTLSKLHGFVLAAAAPSPSPQQPAALPPVAPVAAVAEASSPQQPAAADAGAKSVVAAASSGNKLSLAKPAAPAGVAAISSPPAASASVLMTIKPMQSGVGSIQSVPVPANVEFRNGSWTKVAASPVSGARRRSAGFFGDDEERGDDQEDEEEEEEDPFANFSDEDAPPEAPVTPRKQQEQSATLAPASGSLRGKRAVMSGTLRRRAGLDDPAGAADINEEDLQGFEDRQEDDDDDDGGEEDDSGLLVAGGSAGAGAAASGGGDFEDPFGDIEDLPVDLEEEAARCAAEKAKSKANATAAAATAAAGGQKSAAAVAARAKAIARKTSTLRAELAKHMGKDDEISAADLRALEGEEEKTDDDESAEQQQQRQHSRQHSRQRSQQRVAPVQPPRVDEEFGEPDELAAQLDSPRAQKLFAPDLEPSKRAASVTELSTRREGQAIMAQQQQEDEEWAADVELSAAHLRHASLSAGADDRPDDLDGLDDEDDDEDEGQAIAPASQTKLHVRRGGDSNGSSSSSSSSDFTSMPRSPSSVMSRRTMSAVADVDDRDEMDLSPAAAANSGSSLRRPPSSASLSSSSAAAAPPPSSARRGGHHRPGQRYSNGAGGGGGSAGSNLSVNSAPRHGQLSASLSAEEGLDLDGAMDDDEEQTPVKIVQADEKNKDRAKRERKNHEQAIAHNKCVAAGVYGEAHCCELVAFMCSLLLP
jgi:hypothetical protein